MIGACPTAEAPLRARGGVRRILTGLAVSTAVLGGCGDDIGGGSDDLATARDLAGADRSVGDLAGADLAGADLSSTAPDLASGGGDLAGSDLAMGAADLSTGGADLAGGGVGAACTTACDCMEGLACQAAVCTQLMTAVYCCSWPGCPQGAQCQDAQGVMRFCGLTGDGGVLCTQVACKNGGDALCIALGCTMCIKQGPMLACQ